MILYCTFSSLNELTGALITTRQLKNKRYQLSSLLFAVVRHHFQLKIALDNRQMNQKFWSGLVLLAIALGTTSSGHAEQTDTQKPNLLERLGKTQRQRGDRLPITSENITTTHSHELQGQNAVTLYVRNIPVLTFLDSAPVVSDPIQDNTPLRSSFEIATSQNIQTLNQQIGNFIKSRADAYQKHPKWRAAAVAEKLDRMYQEQVDANTITLSWEQHPETDSSSDEFRERYIIKVDGEELVVVDGNTILPDTTGNLTQDALQATNRLRRQLGNAPPLQEIEGKPILAVRDASAIEQLENNRADKYYSRRVRRLRGLASWYGPGFHGNLTANGEIYNQYALTAAHKSLSFGTMVRVTNLDNGRSVVVRINDRGPYIGGRIIDVSVAAAEVLGLLESGVAPVQVEILGKAANKHE